MFLAGRLMATLAYSILFQCFFQHFHLIQPFPGQIHIGPAEMAIGRRLPVNGPAQVQAPDDPAGVREKFFSISSTIFSSGMAAVPKVFTLMDTGRATPMA